jgi:hypothetical protein
MLNKRPPVDKRSVSKRDFDRLPKFQEGGFAVLNRLLPSEKKTIEETSKYYDTYNDLVNRYNQELEDYKNQYRMATEAYDLSAKDYEARYNRELENFNRAMQAYNRQGEEFQRTQIDPYNAAVIQYQKDQEAYAKAYQDYLNQYSAAEQAYESQYSDYEKAYQAYLDEYAKYEAAFPEYEKRFNEYQNTYNSAFEQYKREVDAYNALLEDYQNKTYVPYGQDSFATYRVIGGRQPSLENVENSRERHLLSNLGNNQNFLFTLDPDSGLYVRRQSPTESRALEINKINNSRWQYIDPVTKQVLFTAVNTSGKGNFVTPTFQERVGQDYYLTGGAGNLVVNYFKQPTASVPNAPAFTPPSPLVPEPQFKAQAPTPQLPTFTAREPTFTREVPVFNVQEPTFGFSEAAPVFQFDRQAPVRPEAPKMNPEQLQAYADRARKLAGYRSSGLEKAFEMGIAPEIAQYFKRGVM